MVQTPAAHYARYHHSNSLKIIYKAILSSMALKNNPLKKNLNYISETVSLRRVRVFLSRELSGSAE